VSLPAGVPHLLIFLLIWIIALQAQNDVLFGVVWGLAALYGADQLWVRLAVATLRIHRRFPDRAYTGTQITLDTSIRNAGLLPVLWAELSDAIPTELRLDEPFPEALSLGPHAEVRLSTKATCTQRGYYRIGPLNVLIADPLGLTHRELNAIEARPLIVYPRVVPLRRLRLPSPSALAVLPSRTPLFEDPARLVGVREYEPTDSLRRVHWSATARMGGLMVKEFEYGTSRSTMLCLDLCRADFVPRDRIHATELAIVAAASLASHAVTREHLEVGLRVEGYDPMSGETPTLRLPPRADSGHLMTILEVLARVRTVQGGDFAAVLRDEARRLPWGTTLVAITGSEGAELGETLLRLKRAGHSVSVIVVSREAVPQIPPAIPLHRLWGDDTLVAGEYDGRVH
jgi:uncharacterized protein (DUF58 family)